MTKRTDSDFVIHDYDYKINNTWSLIKKELSDDVALIQKYDDLMINQALAKVIRLKHLQIILNLDQILKKNWHDISIYDVDNW